MLAVFVVVVYHKFMCKVHMRVRKETVTVTTKEHMQVPSTLQLSSDLKNTLRQINVAETPVRNR